MVDLRHRGALAVLAAGCLVLAGLGGGCRRRAPESSPAPLGERPTPPATEPELESEPASAPPKRAPPEDELGLSDAGIWPDLDARVRLAPIEGFAGPRSLVVDPRRGVATLYDGGWPRKVYPTGGPVELRRAAGVVALRPGDAAELEPWLGPDDLRVLPPGAVAWPGDRDGDGIVDPLDVVLGARKTDLNDARYDPEYVALSSPGGDVPRTQGVCTDVIVRALRNAGVDLQVELFEDIGRAPRAYPMVETANDDIDHRRVKTILPWFRRHLEAHTVELDDVDDPYRPGDVVFMDTIPSRAGPDHIGVVSDARDASGRYLVINNWDTGSVTDSLALLGRVAVTHRFRLRPAPVEVPIPATARQLVVVRARDWNDFHATLRRYERAGADDPWRPLGDPVPVVLGAKGLGWGRGLHGAAAPGGRGGPVKVEGDMKSPAGVFSLGRGFGTSAGVQAVGDAVSPSGPDLRCVDDPTSRHYGRVVDENDVEADWDSAERMQQSAYRLAVTLEHNTAPSRPGAGSCIFLHAWRSPDDPVSGCTAMADGSLDALVDWLDVERAVYVALPEAEYRALRPVWSLP